MSMHIATSSTGNPSTSQLAADARLEARLNRMTLDELHHLQSALHAQFRTGLPSVEQLADALDRDHPEVAIWIRSREVHCNAVKMAKLLGALTVAIVWRSSRRKPAPQRRLQDAIARTCDEHVYVLPIPLTEQCFCHSGKNFRECHGMMPLASAAI